MIDMVLVVATQPIAPNGKFLLPDRSVAINLILKLKIDSKKKVDTLIKALDDPRHRVACANALGEMGPDAKESLPILKKLKLDSNKETRDAAEKAIDSIKD